VIVLLLACTDTVDPSETCTIEGELGAGRGAGTFAGESWEPSGVSFTWAGASLQFNAPPHDGYSLTVVGMVDKDGATLEAAVAEEAYPIHVTLLDGADGGFATVYPDTGASFSTDLAEGGLLQVLREDADGGFVACFDFVVGNEAGETLVMDNGQIRAMPL
jgi:hypothetical protein